MKLNQKKKEQKKEVNWIIQYISFSISLSNFNKMQK